jgi:hypothetical protein
MVDDELESGPKLWRQSNNAFVGLSDLQLYRECFKRSEEIERRLHNSEYAPAHRLPPQARKDKERFAHETAQLLMALAVRMFPTSQRRDGINRPNNIRPIKPKN